MSNEIVLLHLTMIVHLQIIQSNLAEYIEHVEVEFFDADNHTKYAMALRLFGDVWIVMLYSQLIWIICTSLYTYICVIILQNWIIYLCIHRNQFLNQYNNKYY